MTSLPFVINGRRVPPRPESESAPSALAGSVSLPILNESDVDAVLATDPRILRNVPLHEIVAFLCNVGRNWKSDEYARRRLYIRQLTETLGISTAAAEREANWIALLLASHFRALDLIDAELGSWRVLDSWVPVGEAEVRAEPLGRIFHLLAGNVPLAGVASVLRALITKNSCVVKASSLDPVTPIALALSFLDVDPDHPVSRALHVVHWAGDAIPHSAERLVSSADGLCAWGGRDAIAWASATRRPGVDLLAFGPRRSLALVGRGAPVAETATRLAHDVATYDQRACFSTQRAFVERELVDDLVPTLADALREHDSLQPPMGGDVDTDAGGSLTRLTHEFLGDTVLHESAGQSTVIVAEPSAENYGRHPLGRTLFVHPVDDVTDALDYVDETVQTVAVAPWRLTFELRDRLSDLGVSRIVEPGLSNVFRVGGVHDGLHPLRRLVRLTGVELPSDVHVKGITVQVDQTEFLRRNRFLEFVP